MNFRLNVYFSFNRNEDFFEFWSFLYSKFCQFLMNFHEIKKKNRIFFPGFYLFQNVPQLVENQKLKQLFWRGEGVHSH